MKGVKLKEISGGGGRKAETRTLRVNRMTGPAKERKLCALFTLLIHRGRSSPAELRGLILKFLLFFNFLRGYVTSIFVILTFDWTQNIAENFSTWS